MPDRIQELKTPSGIRTSSLKILNATILEPRVIGEHAVAAARSLVKITFNQPLLRQAIPLNRFTK
jgi:hypothetical protein